MTMSFSLLLFFLDFECMRLGIYVQCMAGGDEDGDEDEETIIK